MTNRNNHRIEVRYSLGKNQLAERNALRIIPEFLRHMMNWEFN